MKRPNILVLIVDALRARNMSCYGYGANTTPQLDRFGREHVLFQHAYTNATWTVPSHASMLSGLYLTQHRIENTDRRRRYNAQIVPLPTVLRFVGYETVAFSQNVMFSPPYGFEDFDSYYSHEDLLGDRSQGDREPGRAGRVSKALDMLRRYREKSSRSAAFFDAVVRWIAGRDPARPFFAMINVLDVHYPWTPAPDLLLSQFRHQPKSLLNQEYRTLQPWQFNPGWKAVTAEHRRAWQAWYDVAVMDADRKVGEFLENLSRWAGWQDLVLVVTSDHGEMLGDHRDIVGHMLSLHDNIMHVPLMVKHPGYPANVTVQGVVQTLDLYPSVVEWAGVDTSAIPPAQLQRPSYSQAVHSPSAASGLAFAEEDYTDSYRVAEGLQKSNPDFNPGTYPRQQIAVHSATHKYIWYDDRPGEFFDLRRDPFEERDMMSLSQQTDTLIYLEQALDVWRDGLQVFPPVETETVEDLDQQALDRLRALGYLA